MANPIKSSDLYQDTGEIKKLIAELETVNTRLTDLREGEKVTAAKLGASIKNLTGATADQRSQIEAAAKQADQIKRRYDQYNASLGENGVKLAALKTAQSQLNQVNKLEAKLLASKEGSYNRLSAQYSLNKIRLNQMSKAEREATSEGKKLVKESAALFEEMKRLQAETGKNTLNVGNYADALKDLPGPLGRAGSGVKGLGNDLKALTKNPFVLVLSLLIGGLVALGNAFKSSEKGARLLEKGTAVLSALFGQLVQVSVSVAESVESAFNDPKQAVKDLGTAIVENLLNRFKAIPLIGKAVLDSLKAIWNRDMVALEKAGTDAFTAVNQAITGLDGDQQKGLFNAIKDTTEEIIKETDASIKLAAARLAVRRANRSLTRSIEQLTTTEQKYQGIADDVTKSFKEREAAADLAREALEARSKKEIELARNNLSIINRDLAARRANGLEVEALLDEQLSAYQSLAAAERSFTLAVQDNERTRAELKQDRLEKDLDILIDGFDNQKTINERLLKDDQLTFAARQKIASDTAIKADETFAKQIQTIQKFTGVAVNANDLIKESDTIALNEKIRSLGLSEIIEGRLLEIVRERRIVQQDLAESQTELSEAKRKADLEDLRSAQTLAAAEFDLVERTTVEQTEFKLKAKQAELKKIQELNEQTAATLPPIDTAALAIQIKELQNQILAARREAGLESLDEQQAFEQSEFDLLKKSESEKTKFKLLAEKTRLETILKLNEKFNGNLSATAIQTLKNQIKAFQKEIDGIGKSGDSPDIYERLGFDFSEERKQGITSAFSFAKSQVLDFVNSNVQLSEQLVSQKNTEVDQAQRALDIEIQNRNAGFAHKVDTAQKELAAAKKTQADALKEAEKAKKAQLAIESVQQASSLITAAAGISAKVKNPLIAIPLIALMFASFAGAKIKALQLTKKTFGHGDILDIGNGTHASGNDTPIGVTVGGQPAYAERGEKVAIFNRRSVGKYGSRINEVFHALNRGIFEQKFQAMNSAGRDDGTVLVQAGGPGVDTSRMENSLETIARNASKSERKDYHDANGNLTRSVYKNITTIYVK